MISMEQIGECYISMLNLEIREFSQSIINFVNASQLPMEVKRLALKDILSQVEAETNKVLQSELQSRETANTSGESEVEE